MSAKKGRAMKRDLGSNYFSCDQSGLAAVANEVVQIEHLSEGANILTGGFSALDDTRDPLVAFGVAGPELLEPGGPSEDLVRLAFGAGVQPGENFGVGFAGLDFREHSVGGDPGECEQLLVQRAVVMIVSGFAGDIGTGLIEQAGEMGIATDAYADAAGGMLSEVGSAIVDHVQNEQNLDFTFMQVAGCWKV